MKIFRLHWIGHFMYLTALVALGLLGKNHLAQAVETRQAVARIQRHALPVFQQPAYESGRYWAERGQKIEKPGRSFPQIKWVEHARWTWQNSPVARQANRWRIPQNEAIEQRAWHAFLLESHFLNNCEAAEETLQSGVKPAQSESIASIVPLYFQLGDSLTAVFQQDSGALACVRQYLIADYEHCPATRLSALLATSDTAAAAQLIRAMRLKADLTIRHAFAALHQSMVLIKPFRYDHLIPAFSCRHSPRVGRPFQASVFLSNYTLGTSDYTLTVMVDKQIVPMESGVAHYRTIFSRPGHYRLPVNIVIKNLPVGWEQNNKREFEVQVAPHAE